MEMNRKLNCSDNIPNRTYSHRHSHQLQLFPIELIVLFLVFVHVVGSLGNAVVVFIVIKKRRMQSYMNWLILNLAIADISVSLLYIPLRIPLIVYGKWIYGKFFCSIYYPMVSSAMTTSVFTLVALNSSRFWAITRPFGGQASIFGGKIIICVTWMLSLALTLPQVIVLGYDEEGKICFEYWHVSKQRIYTMFIFVVVCALPLLIIAVAYVLIIISIMKKPRKLSYKDKRIRTENKKLVILSVIISMTFGICLLPNQIVWILYNYSDFDEFKYSMDITLGAELLLFLNSALNPIIYNVFCATFREEFRQLFRVYSCIKQKRERDTPLVTLRSQ